MRLRRIRESSKRISFALAASFVAILQYPHFLLAQTQPPKREFRGAWIATVTNIDWPSSNGLTTAAQQTELTTLLDELKAAGFNAVIFQVRTECDAFYNSPYEPWSYWLTGKQGAAPLPYYDPLQFAVQEAHKRGMEIHAWFNPYRAIRPSSYQRDTTHVSVRHPDWLLNFPSISTQILNPGLPQVRDYVATVVSDIIRRYDIDGIHADDYFYPYPDGTFPGITTEDTATYRLHNPDSLDIASWRRENVNKLIAQIHDSVEAIKPWVKFGMSPFGIWRPSPYPPGVTGLDAYNTIYCDALTWLDRGIIDYLAPQLYWPFGGGQDYGKLQPWWADSVSAHGRHLYTGNATYRIGTYSNGATEMANEINFNRANPKVQGSIQFSASWIPANVSGWTDLLKSSVFAYPALIPVMSWKAPQTAPTIPTNLQFVSVPGSNLYSLNWTAPAQAADGDTAARYLVYRFAGATVGDTSNSRNTIDLEGVTTTTPASRIDSLGVQQYTFAVSAVDRYNHEGPLASIAPPAASLVSAPTPVYPAIAEQNYPRSGKLQWSRPAFAGAYILQVDSTPSFDPEKTFLTLKLTDTAVAVPNLKAQAVYYWRIAAGGQFSTSNYSDSVSFTTGWPLPPTLISPPITTGVPLTPTFVWSRSQGSSFELLVSDNGTHAILVDTTVTDTTCTISTSLEGLKIYAWEVIATNAYGSSDPSPQSRFKTAEVTLVAAENGTPLTFELSQNYPNPFNPTTTIRFTIAHYGKTRLVIYDLLGREVSTLVDQELPAGMYTARFDAQNMTSGAYFYVLTSGSTRLVNKMIFLK